MQPSMRMRVAAKVPITPKSGAVASKGLLLPTLAWLGAAAAVGLYVKRQLHQKSDTFDHMFEKQNRPEVMASRSKSLLLDMNGVEPRNNMLNILGWTSSKK